MMTQSLAGQNGSERWIVAVVTEAAALVVGILLRLTLVTAVSCNPWNQAIFAQRVGPVPDGQLTNRLIKTKLLASALHTSARSDGFAVLRRIKAGAIDQDRCSKCDGAGHGNHGRNDGRPR